MGGHPRTRGDLETGALGARLSRGGWTRCGMEGACLPGQHGAPGREVTLTVGVPGKGFLEEISSGSAVDRGPPVWGPHATPEAASGQKVGRGLTCALLADMWLAFAPTDTGMATAFQTARPSWPGADSL